MSSLDFQKGVFKLCEDSGLDSLIKSSWTEEDRSSFLSINDEEAAPNQPFPYCVVEFNKPSLSSRSTGACRSDELREYREIAFSFSLHTKHTGHTSAKIAAGELAEKFKEVFGGSPEVTPQIITLAHGSVLLCTYISDFPEKTGDQEHQWTIDYLALVDVPLKI